MKNNKIENLRDHLFSTIDKLMDDQKPMDIERARAISDVAQVIINSAKVEVDYMKNVGGLGSGFIPMQPLKLEDKK
ncbi:MAG TPA: hypothetical protein VFF27_00075 [Bacteroidia bacterium]|jgi:hypothetical protein|nr:hypothetical protein [Bacteroidia bacterium]